MASARLATGEGGIRECDKDEEMSMPFNHIRNRQRNSKQIKWNFHLNLDQTRSSLSKSLFVCSELFTKYIYIYLFDDAEILLRIRYAIKIYESFVE